MSIKIIVAGPRGKMGSEALRMIKGQTEFELVACIDHKNNGKKVHDIDSLPKFDVPIYEDPEECLSEVSADVLIDLTIPKVGFKHAKLAIQHHVRPVIGTSGFTQEEIQELTVLAKELKVGCIIAPNFAIGAILMMKFSKLAAAYFPDVEIIEKHHDNKLDAPSGTAVKTVELIQEVRERKQQGHPNEYETVAGARGAEIDGLRVHSMRLPGLVAHQEVVFGGPGQTLSIKHDSLNRESFMDGVKFSIDEVMTMDTLVYGLENIIE